MKSTLKRNLFWGLSLSMIILVISSVASYYSISNLIESSRQVRKSTAIINNLNEVMSIMKDAETGQRGYLLSDNPLFLEPYNSALKKMDESLFSLEQLVANRPYGDKIIEMETDIRYRLGVLDSNINLKRTTGAYSNKALVIGKHYMDEIRRVNDKIIRQEQVLLSERTDKLREFANYTPAIILFSALLAIGITLYSYRRVSRDFEERMMLQNALEQKNIETENRIDAIEKIASQISHGQYDIRLNASDADGLGSLSSSLNKMAISLQHSFNQLQNKEWLQEGIALLNNKMVGEKTVHHLVEDILENITAYTKSQVAALYILEEDMKLYLTETYALNRELIKSPLKLGEGLVGQCAQSRKTILLADIEENDLTVSYSSGKTKLQHVVAIQIERDNELIGVMELGALHEFSPLQMEFLEAVSNNIGIAISTAQNRKKMQELLEETQTQSEELQSQHSELENMNAELEAQTQKLQASEEELKVQQEELLQSNQELEERTTLLEERNQLIRERNEEIQQKSRDLEQSSKYKSEFLANMSHELRTPLNSILLLSKLMADSEILDKEYVEYAEVIQSSGQGLLSLIDEILDLSKIESGKMQLEIDEITLAEISKDLYSLFLPQAKNKNLQFRIDVLPDTAHIIKSDKMKLEQILKNLLANAVKFTSQGEVTLTISEDKQHQKINFQVADTGIGIAREKLDVVFEAFKQADGSTRRKFGGTGLGLSISRQLAKLLGGDIEIQSEENKGSLFTLSLPIEFRENQESDVQEIVSEPIESEEQKITVPVSNFIVSHIPNRIEDDRDNIKPGEDKVILIVEDDTPFAKILLDYTRKKNYKCIVAVSGDDGIAMARHFKPKAILLDLQLPVMDGWQVMEALKADPQTRPIPVHIMSSLMAKNESLLKGAVDFINKPFALEDMQKIFQRLEKKLSRDPKKVLIVEENPQHAKALSYYLSANNISTEIAKDVNNSIESLQKNEIDCVILDMVVPDQNAYKTLEVIKQNKGFEQLPIIVFTGKNLSIGEENRIKKYADSIVVKTAHSYQRILDETGLFLHLVEQKNKRDTDPFPPKSPLNELRNILKNKSVLIVDDDVRNIFSLTKALEMHSMKVFTATDGREAVNTLHDNPKIDVILMDMMMPEMDGYETIQVIRKDPKFRHTPILAVTAKAMMGDREKCISAGASDYISKPVDSDQLISLLRVWLYDKN